MPVSVAIVDDHKLFAKSLEMLVKTFSDYQVIFCCADGSQLVERISKKFRPDIILLDQQMPGMDGLATVVWLKANYPDIKIIILSMNYEEETVLDLVFNGINGYVLKDAEIAELKAALDTVRDDKYYYPKFVTNFLLEHAKQKKGIKTGPPFLKNNEIEFLKLASTELTYKEIADKMNLSVRTVDGYREMLFKKLNVKSRVGLVLYSINNNLI
jgi:DNA-binding NarL/FixJ family response regulator